MKLNCLIVSIHLLFAVSIKAQQLSETEKFLSDVLKNQAMYYSQPAVLRFQDSAFTEYHLNELITSPRNTFYLRRQMQTVDSITLTIDEKTFLINSIRSQYKSSWKDSDIIGYTIIQNDSMLSYLKTDRKNTVVFISKPIFFRSEKLAFAFWANFCCGHIYGHVDLSFYRKNEEGIWTRWISVSAGDF